MKFPGPTGACGLISPAKTPCAKPQPIFSAARTRPSRSARIAGVTVFPMIVRPKARELIVGVADDPTFGPVIAFGQGGTAVEVISDKSLALPPLNLDLAERPDRAHARVAHPQGLSERTRGG